MRIYICVALFIIMWFLGGCSAPVKDVHIPDDTYIITGKIKLTNSKLVKSELYDQYSEWKGTRYRMGGLNKNGVDCSGFVYITFKYKFGITLPRSTEHMARLGINVTKGEWRAGDLVFFKTGISDKHVGVYIDNGQFLHASSSQGIIISKLNNQYWQSTYWKAKRI
ncbi:MAG: C40 family peptidase [Desulfamplus sp.]|nr:C40 family peptidase [Desulfamplus sp.]